MASLLILHSSGFLEPRPQPLSRSHFRSSKSILRLKELPLSSRFQRYKLNTQTPRARTIVFNAQSDFLKVIRKAWKVGEDGIAAGTSMVPNSVPRPVARISVTIVALTVALFVFKSLLSTVFFVLATMGLVYFIFIALNKDDDGPRKGGTSSSGSGSDDPLEEAKKIMEKYK